jgi:glutamate formiminotransferase
MNLVDLDRTQLHEAVEFVRADGARRGVEIADGELVGLVPATVLAAAAAAGVDVPGIDESRVLENALPL